MCFTIVSLEVSEASTSVNSFMCFVSMKARKLFLVFLSFYQMKPLEFDILLYCLLLEQILPVYRKVNGSKMALVYFPKAFSIVKGNRKPLTDFWPFYKDLCRLPVHQSSLADRLHAHLSLTQKKF